MKKSYQKWLLAAGIVAVIVGIMNLVTLLLLKYNATLNTQVTNLIREYMFWLSLSDVTDMKKFLIENFTIATICNILVGAYMIFMACRSTVMYYKRQFLLGILVVAVVLFGDLSLIAILLYVVAIFKANRRISSTASMLKTSTQTKQYQLLNAQEYAKKLKELRDRGEITQEEFLQEIDVVTQSMTTLMNEIAKEKEK